MRATGVVEMALAFQHRDGIEVITPSNCDAALEEESKAAPIQRKTTSKPSKKHSAGHKYSK